MSTLTSSLIISLIDKLTGPARNVNAAISRMSDAVRRNSAQMDAARGRMVDAVGAAYALAQGLSAPVNAAMEFENAMADIKKVVNFDTPEGFAAMGKEIRTMAIRDIPMAADGIAAIVAAAGQSGIAVEDLTKFADMAAKVSVAWETGAGETGEALAKLKTALGLSVPETGLLADAINHLGNNTAASAPDILNFTRRVAPMARQFGFTTEQAAAMGSAMIGSGFEAEVAATSFLNMGRALTKGASATPSMLRAYATLGLNSKKVAKAMQTDAVGTVKTVLAQINKLPAHRRASIISDIFGDEARALGPLINDAGLMAKVLELIGDKASYAGSAQAEFDERSKTTANALQLFKNRVNDLAISIGDALLPAFNSVLGVIGPIVTSVSDLAQRFPRATAAIVMATSAIIAFRVATAAASYAALFMKGSVLQMGLVGLKGVGAASTAAATAVGAFSSAVGLGAKSSRRAAREAVAGAQAVLQQRQAAYQAAQAMLDMARKGQVAGVSVRQASTNLAAAGRAAVEAQAGLKAANAAMVATSRTAAVASGAMKALKIAMMSTGIGLALVAIGAAGAWIYNNWDGIGAAFSAFGDEFTKAIEPLRPMLDPIINGVSSLIDWVSNLLGPVDELGEGWTSVGRAAGKFVGDTVVAIAQLPGKIAAQASALWEAGGALMQSLWDGTVARWDGFVAWGKSIPAQVSGWFAGIDLSAIGDGIGQFVDSVVARVSGLPSAIATQAAALWEAGGALVQALWDGAVAKFDEFIAWAKEIPARIVAAIGRIDLSNVISWPSLPSWMGGSGSPAGAPSGGASGGTVPIDGARAKGGPVRAGGTYLVGEEGRELFTPGRSGAITPNDVLNEMGRPRPAATMAATRSMGDVSIQISVPGVVVRSETDIDKLVRELGRRLRDEMQALHGDLNYAANV